MLAIYLQAQCESNGTSDNPRVPANFEFLGFQWELLPPDWIETGQQVSDQSSDNGQEEENNHGHGDRQPLAVDAENAGSQVGIDESLSNIGDSFEGQPCAPLSLMRDIHKGVVSHDNSTCEQTDDSWQSCNFTDQVGQVPIEEDQAGLLDGESGEWFVHFQ